MMIKTLASLGAVALAANVTAMAKCPPVTVLKETATIVQMGASGDPKIRAYDATMSGPTTTCSQDNMSVNVNLSFNVAGRLAPNVEAKPVRVPYFVAFLRGDHVMTKQVFSVGLNFGPAAQVVNVTETVDKIMYPIANADRDYSIVIGFQLSPEQLRQNQQ